MIEMWHKAGFNNVQGSDITSVAVEGLTRRFPSHRFVEVDISAGQVPYSNEFDAVSANDILFHIVDDAAYQRALSNVFAALRPGGFFVFTENFLHGPTQRAEHQVSRSLRDIEAMLRQAGFVTIVRRPLFVLMNNPVDSNSWLLRSWWRNLVRVLHRAPRTSGAVGTLLYGPELALVRAVRDGPSTEVMVCRRPTTSA
jgi:SAM-dependent methyltransferase